MKTNYTFLYRIGTVSGTCSAVSVAQAKDRAKVDYLKTWENITPSSPRFKLSKSKLTDVSVEVELAQHHRTRYSQLYKIMRDGDYNATEKAEFDQLNNLINNIR
jgi:hypothetical protein